MSVESSFRFPDAPSMSVCSMLAPVCIWFSIQIFGSLPSPIAISKPPRRNVKQFLRRHIFDVFPATQRGGDGSPQSANFAGTVRDQKIADTMAVQRYPIRVGVGNEERFEVRYWSPNNSPVLNAVDGQLKYIILASRTLRTISYRWVNSRMLLALLNCFSARRCEWRLRSLPGLKKFKKPIAS